MADIQKALNETVVFVLEDWAMMLVDETPDNFAFPEEERHAATARFSGPFQGTLSLRCSREFLSITARNLLGLDFGEEISQEGVLDVLKELANVISGNFLTTAYGQDVTFDMVEFSVDTPEALDDKTYQEERAVSYLGDDEPITVTFNLGG